MNQPATVGRGLGRAIALATLFGMAVFGTIVAIVIYISELDEECAPGVFVDDPPLVIIEEVGVALAFAGPVGIGVSWLLGRRMTRGTTKRLDGIIESASAMSGERLDERLPVSNASDPQDPLDRLAIAFNELLGRVEDGVRAQRQFAADASHELRTPLTVISTNLEVARRKPRETGHWEHVADDTLAEVKRMNDIVEKLLQLSRAGASGLERDRRDLRALASTAVERADAFATAHQIRVELAPGQQVDGDIDVNAMSIALDNLIRNAIDHSPSDESIRVTVERAVAGPRILVEDRGPGVPQEMRARIFEPFARGVQRASDRTAGPGLGLGLAIAKRIVDGHGGSVFVEDRPGGGARFVIALPVPHLQSREEVVVSRRTRSPTT